MNSEITELNAASGLNGSVFYDAECRLCVAGIKRWGKAFERRGFAWIPLQTPGTAERLGLTQAELMAEMKLLRADGRVAGGVDALAVLLRSVFWLRPLGALLTLPGIHYAARLIYREVAARRHCRNGACQLRQDPTVTLRGFDATMFVVLPLAAMWVAWNWPAWVFMWTLGVSLGMVGKWLAWRDTVKLGLRPGFARTLGWFVAWPGLDGRAFLGNKRDIPRPNLGEWAFGIGKLALGCFLLWGLVPLGIGLHPLVGGWVGMVGVVFILHFGLFHLLSLAWRSAGVDAQPIMRWPIVARSLGEFWGERWNTAFSIPARRFVLLPLARNLGSVAAGFAVYFLSGLLHELVISLPAGAGIGLPTAYFALQGLAAVIERSRAGRSLGLGRGWRGWAFTFLVTAGPVAWLFHPHFIYNVILPMLEALGAM